MSPILRLWMVLVCVMLMAVQCEKDPPPCGFSACDDADDPIACEIDRLPPKSSSGANMLGALVNGKAWISRGGAGFSKPQLTVNYYKGSFWLSAHRYGFSQREQIHNQLLETVRLKTNGYAGPGLYRFESDTCAAEYTDHENRCDYNDDSWVSGKLLISHFDTVRGIASGEFSFRIFNDGKRTSGSSNTNVCDTMAITHGRFDVKIWE